jgi:excisionase family DNA binding protein
VNATLEAEDRTEATLLDVRAVAALLSCSTRHVYRLSDAGRMPPPARLGALVRWSRRAVEQWIVDGCPAVRKGGRP